MAHLLIYLKKVKSFTVLTIRGHHSAIAMVLEASGIDPMNSAQLNNQKSDLSQQTYESNSTSYPSWIHHLY